MMIIGYILLSIVVLGLIAAGLGQWERYVRRRRYERGEIEHVDDDEPSADIAVSQNAAGSMSYVNGRAFWRSSAGLSNIITMKSWTAIAVHRRTPIPIMLWKNFEKSSTHCVKMKSPAGYAVSNCEASFSLTQSKMKPS